MEIIKCNVISNMLVSKILQSYYVRQYLADFYECRCPLAEGQDISVSLSLGSTSRLSVTNDLSSLSRVLENVESHRI